MPEDTAKPKEKWFGGFTLGFGPNLTQGRLREGFRFPVHYQFGASLRYRSLLLAGEIRGSYGATRTDRNADPYWRSRNGASLNASCFYGAVKVFKYECLTLWPFAGLDATSLEVHTKEPLPNATLYAYNNQTAGLIARYEITREYKRYDYGTLFLALKYQCTQMNFTEVPGYVHCLTLMGVAQLPFSKEAPSWRRQREAMQRTETPNR